MDGKQWGTLGIGILAGAVVGGVVALLFAPKSGKETRAFIKEKAGDIKDKVSEKVSGIRHSVGDKISGDGERELVHK
jgi:gas vesicle protein